MYIYIESLLNFCTRRGTTLCFHRFRSSNPTPAAGETTHVA